MRRRTAARGSGSLLGTAARTAVIASTATKVSARTAEREAVRRGAPAAQVAPAPAPVAAPAPAPAADPSDMLAQLKQLGDLRDAGVLTEDEFAAAKAKILG